MKRQSFELSDTNSERLWFLKKLKRADNLVYYYQAVIRPLLEYASVLWHSSLSTEQTQSCVTNNYCR